MAKTPTVHALKFGRQPPKGVKVAWGARAIFKPVSKNPMIDLLWDRQDGFGSDEDKKDLLRWVDTVGMPWLHEQIEDQDVYSISRSMSVFRLARDGYVIEASPQGSYGHLYIGAWKK